MTGSLKARPTRMTAAGGLVDHLVDEDALATALRARTGVYRAVCSVSFPSAAMTDQPNPLCTSCNLIWHARQNLRTFEQRTGFRHRRETSNNLWPWVFGGQCATAPDSRRGRGDKPRHALRPRRVPGPSHSDDQGR
jgi:hypothetical protein